MRGELESDAHEPSAEKFVVRLPFGMRRIIAEVARRNRRSMNSEIVAILESALREGPSEAMVDERGINALLTQTEADLLRKFRRMSDTQRRAWADLLG